MPTRSSARRLGNHLLCRKGSREVKNDPYFEKVTISQTSDARENATRDPDSFDSCRRRRSDPPSGLVAKAVLHDVLFIDDDPYAVNAFQKSVPANIYRVQVATNPDEALELAHAQDFKVVVTDFGLPGLDGLSLLERIREIQPDAALLLVTGQVDLQLRDSIGTAPLLLGTLRKPWDIDELQAMLTRAVEHHEVRAADKQTSVRPRVLVVEDNPGDADLLQTDLEEQCDALVEVSTCVSEAEHSLTQQMFDIIITDLSLPDARGTDAVRRLRRAAPRSALLVRTGIADDALMRQMMRLGAQSYLLKNRRCPEQLRREVFMAVERASDGERIRRLAHYDQLTGLANRLTLGERFNYAASIARESGTEIGFINVDLDRFKEVNDMYGHEAGDALLRSVAGRLTAAVRDHDTVARLGGDEFALLLTNIASRPEVRVVAERIVESMRAPFELEAATVTISASVGCACQPGARASLDKLMKKSDSHMYNAKRNGRDQVGYALGVVRP